jgi:cell wall-associated NlpC family hydrolase
MIEEDGNKLIVSAPQGEEEYLFATAAEAEGRAAVVREALSWVGTPFRDCGDVKGGAVDCAMLLVRAFVDTGHLAPFDPRPYPPRWHLHKDRERFLEWVEERFGARRLFPGSARGLSPGYIVIWQFGRCFSHGAIVINSEEVVHAYAHARMCVVSRLDEHPLRFVGHGAHELPRPVRYYDMWASRSPGPAEMSQAIVDFFDHGL